MTLNGEGHDPEIFEAYYLENQGRYMVGVNGPPIGNQPLRIQCSRDRWCHVTQNVVTLICTLCWLTKFFNVKERTFYCKIKHSNETDTSFHLTYLYYLNPSPRLLFLVRLRVYTNAFYTHEASYSPRLFLYKIRNKAIWRHIAMNFRTGVYCEMIKKFKDTHVWCSMRICFDKY